MDVFEGLKAKLSENDLVLDGGECEIGIESTIVDCTGTFPKILRPGFISEEKILAIFEANYGKIKETTGESSLDCKLNTWPGMSKKHYSPKANVVLSQITQEGDGFFALDSIQTPIGAIRLGSPTNVEEFAHTLYSVLRKGDSIGLKRIVIEPPDGAGLPVAIRDRLKKAAGMP